MSYELIFRINKIMKKFLVFNVCLIGMQPKYIVLLLNFWTFDMTGRGKGGKGIRKGGGKNRHIIFN